MFSSKTPTNTKATPAEHINNTKSKKGRSALIKAINVGNESFALDLMSDPTTDLKQADDKGGTPLHYAVLVPEILTKLLEKKAALNLNAQTEVGDTALHLAVHLNKPAIVAELLKSDASTSTTITKTAYRLGFPTLTKGDTLLHTAFSHKELNQTLITMLLENTAFAQLNIPNDNNITPFQMLIQHPQIASLPEKMLDSIFNKANFLRKMPSATPTLFHLAASNHGITHGILTKLYNKHVDAGLLSASDQENQVMTQNFLSQKNNNDLTPLVLAAQSGNLEVVNFLYSICQFLFRVGPQSEKAMSAALLHQQIPTVKRLIDCGVNPDAHVTIDDDHSSSITSFSFSSSKTRHAPDKSALLRNGDTPMHYAVRANDLELALACLKSNAKIVNSPNAQGKSPAFIAVQYLSPVMAHEMWKANKGIIPALRIPGADANRCVTAQMSGATRGFKDRNDLANFFSNPNYELTDKQKALLAAHNQKHKRGAPQVSVAKLGVLSAPVPLKPDEPVVVTATATI